MVNQDTQVEGWLVEMSIIEAASALQQRALLAEAIEMVVYDTDDRNQKSVRTDAIYDWLCTIGLGGISFVDLVAEWREYAAADIPPRGA